MMKSYAHTSFTREQWLASTSKSIEESPIVNKLARRPVIAEKEVATQVNCYTRQAQQPSGGISVHHCALCRVIRVEVLKRGRASKRCRTRTDLAQPDR